MLRSLPPSPAARGTRVAPPLCAAALFAVCDRGTPAATVMDRSAASPAAVGPAGQAEAQKAPGLRKVVRKAELTLEVASTSAAHARAIAIAEKYGGYVARAQTHSAPGGSEETAPSSLSPRG